MFSFVIISQVIGWDGSVLCTSQEIDCKDRLQNECVERDVNLTVDVISMIKSIPEVAILHPKPSTASVS